MTAVPSVQQGAIILRESGNWQVRYYDEYGHRRSATFTDRDEAQVWLDKRVTEVRLARLAGEHEHEVRRVEERLDSLLTARQVAELIGFSPATVVDWAERGEIPCFKIGGRLRFRRSEVDGWLEGKRKA